MTTRSELLRQAAELQKKTYQAYEPIFKTLGYSEFPPEHVVDAVVKAVKKRIELFRARNAPEQKQCSFCDAPLGASGDDGTRECPECKSRVDRLGLEVGDDERTRRD
jgi:hypothetical protein